MAFSWVKARPQTAIESAFKACRASLLLVLALSFFINVLALTVPLYLLNVYDHVLSSQSLDTLVMLTAIVVVALAVHAVLEALRREILARVGTWIDDRLQGSVLTTAVQTAARNDLAGAAQIWRDLTPFAPFSAEAPVRRCSTCHGLRFSSSR